MSDDWAKSVGVHASAPARDGIEIARRSQLTDALGLCRARLTRDTVPQVHLAPFSGGFALTLAIMLYWIR